MKKTILAAIVGLLMLAFGATMVSAGPNTDQMHSFWGGQSKLTDAQKQEMAPYFDKMKDLRMQMFEVRKEMIQKQVGFGYMTQAEADQHIAKMQERMEKGPRMGHEKMGRGPGGNGCQMTPQQQSVNK